MIIRNYIIREIIGIITMLKDLENELNLIKKNTFFINFLKKNKINSFIKYIQKMYGQPRFGLADRWFLDELYWFLEVNR